ncbi:MAG: nucleoside hydrolase [Cyclobacteriaceae bacterium]|nr:nucleoside hydrolase [Cyclobacteriaceae bacterium]
MKFAIFPFLLALLLHASFALAQTTKTRVIVDADTGNEVDDLYAITRALIAPEFEVLALNSTQWENSHWNMDKTMEVSQRLNERILSYLNMSNLPHPRGSYYRLYDWGQDVAQYSGAAHRIILEAQKASPEHKLTIIALGALTNVASALLIAPDIAPNIRLYCLGTSYHFEKGYWKKTDFNCLMDPHAIDVVFDNAALEVHITPVNVAATMKVTREKLAENFMGKQDLRGFLYERWMTHMDGGYHERVLWDLLPVYMLLKPGWAEEVMIGTPPENTARQIYVTKSFDHKKMEEDFWLETQKYFDTRH